MSNPFKGIATHGQRTARRKTKAKPKREVLTLDAALERMRAIDERSPVIPQPGDIITGAAASAEFARIRQGKR